MRYMKIYAQDLYDDDFPDVVSLEFYDSSRSTPLVHQATAFDMNNDGNLDWARAGDINNDGVKNEWDIFQAITLARQFLDFKWFSRDQPFNKFLKVSAEDIDGSGLPETVCLEFHNEEGRVSHRAHFHMEADGAGSEVATYPDINSDRRVDATDADLLRRFCLGYLALDWFDSTTCAVGRSRPV